MRLFLLFIMVFLSGCSTLVNGLHQEVTIEVPENQVCYVAQGNTMVASLSVKETIEVRRSSKALVVDCGASSKTYLADTTVESWVSIALIDYGLIDFLTGAMWEYSELEH